MSDNVQSMHNRPTFIRRSASAPALLAILLAAIACSDVADSPTMSHPRASAAKVASYAEAAKRNAAFRAEQRASRGLPDTDDLMRGIAADVSGFAGFYIDLDGTPIAAITDVAQADAAVAAVNRVFGDAPNVRGKSVRTRVVRYSYVQISDWTNVVLEAFFGGDMISVLDPDEAHNVVYVAAKDQAARDEIVAGSRDLGIPDDALRVIVAPRYTPSQGSPITLDDSMAPIRAGVLIQSSTGGVCSMGPIVQRANDESMYFLTHSHCAYQDQLDPSTWLWYSPHRPGFGASQLMGHETLDPAPTIPCGSDLCRYSDASLNRVWRERPARSRRANSDVYVRLAYAAERGLRT